MKKLLLLFFSSLYSCLILAQQSFPIPPSIQAAYIKGTRNVNGNPGAGYWQHRTNYKLEINFNPSTRELKGLMNVVYFNNSPDTLTQLWFKLYPNLYKKGVKRKSKIDSADLGEGLNLLAMEIDGRPKLLNTLLVEGTKYAYRYQCTCAWSKYKSQNGL